MGACPDYFGVGYPANLAPIFEPFLAQLGYLNPLLGLLGTMLEHNDGLHWTVFLWPCCLFWHRSLHLYLVIGQHGCESLDWHDNRWNFCNAVWLICWLPRLPLWAAWHLLRADYFRLFHGASLPVFQPGDSQQDNGYPGAASRR
ncbi:hypothetical protein ES708_34716 [subsurface metagenome]